VLIAGVDLAAEPKGTALAVIDWIPGRAVLTDLQLGVADEAIVAAATGVTKIGIDCALGWPVEFINFVNLQAEISAGSPQFDGGIDWRRKLAYRETDRRVRQVTGRWPLSVSTDRLGMTAMRATGLLSKLAQAEIPIDRSGVGRVVEIYPAASMRIWGLKADGYRNSVEVRSTLLEELLTAAPWLEIGTHKTLMLDSCDAFDAVIAGLATRAAALGHYEMPEPDLLDQARIEGWVALPNCPLEALVDSD
jgi:predicted nuclease with RNAse H fold